MRLDGIHHITAITADAPGNVDFYVRVMGIRMVKKTVNFDLPDVYHLYYADEKGSPGSVLTFFEYPDVPPGRAGAGMIHRIVWRVGEEASLDFWAERLEREGHHVQRDTERLLSADPEGLGLELEIDDSHNDPLVADAPDIPAEHALRGFSGVRAFARTPDRSSSILETLGFDLASDHHPLIGPRRSAFYAIDRPPGGPGIQGAGSVHHIAWACEPKDQAAWRERAQDAGATVTPIIDRFYFKSIYFREPNGVLFEIATLGPGFAIDEPEGALGETLALPPQYEHLRAELEQGLTPVTNPRSRIGG